MKITDKEARAKVVRARTNLLVSNGFFGFLALQLQLVEITEEMVKQGYPKTMAVDGKSMFYYPPFVRKCTDRELEGVVAHECMHCCFQHFSRRGNRDPVGFNIAGDYVINLDLIDAGFTLPGKPLSWGQLMSGNKAENIYLYDPKFKGVNTETIYDMLPKVTIKLVAEGNGADPGGCGGVMDAPGGENSKAEAQQTWEGAVRTALAVAKANNAGNLPGSLKHLLDQLNKPKVSWKERTRRFIDQSMTKDVSWARINRRSTAIGTLMPGYVSDRMHHLIMCVDVSGSISYELANSMVSEAAGALDEGTADMMTVIYADTDVVHVDEYVQGDIVTCGHYRGGGTAFANTFKWIKDNAPQASCTIYLTDLEVYDFGEEPACPVLWAVFNSEDRYPHLVEKTPFGEAIHVSSIYG